MKAGVKEGKIKQRKRNLSEGSEENEEPPNKVKKRTRLDFINFSLMLFCVYWLYVVFLTFYILCLNSLFFFFYHNTYFLFNIWLFLVPSPYLCILWHCVLSVGVWKGPKQCKQQEDSSEETLWLRLRLPHEEGKGRYDEEGEGHAICLCAVHQRQTQQEVRKWCLSILLFLLVTVLQLRFEDTFLFWQLFIQ